MPIHPAYYGAITGAKAEERLKVKRGMCFLFRYSEAKICYEISVKSNDDKVSHIKLIMDKDAPSYQLEGSEKSFISLDELIKYFQKNALNPYISNIGEPCLITGNNSCQLY